MTMTSTDQPTTTKTTQIARSGTRRWVLTALTAAACAAAGVVFTRQSADATTTAAAYVQEAGTIGVVDVEAAITGSTKGQQFQQQGQAIQNEFATQLQQLGEQLRSEQAAFNELREGSEQQIEKRRLLRELQGQRQVLQQVAEAELQDFRRTQYLAIYNEMAAAVQKVAQDRGLAVVIRKNISPLPDDLSQLNAQQLGSVLGGQTTLYVSPGADITSEVIQAMNAASGGDEAPATGEAQQSEAGGN